MTSKETKVVAALMLAAATLKEIESNMHPPSKWSTEKEHAARDELSRVISVCEDALKGHV